MRLKQILFLTNHMEITTTEKYSRGRRGAPAKGVGRATGARVQIPLSPLHFQVIIFLTLNQRFKKNKNFCLTTTSKYDKINTRLVRQERRTSRKFEKINKKKLLTNSTTSDILNELLLRQTTTKNLENQRLNSM